MITLNDLINQLNDYLQVPLFKDFCINGLQVQGKREVKKAVTAVTASLKVIRAAVEEGADVLLVHHGIFWDRDSPVVQGVKKEKLALLLENNLSLLAYHLPLDAHQEIGNNWKAARDLGWKDLKPFYQYGVQGTFPECTREDFQKKLEAYYGQMARVALGGKEHVSSAALISGGAYRQVEDACRQEVDCYITGHVDEPAWHMAHEGHINFFGLGHAATEKVGPRALADYLSRVLNLDAQFIDEINPF